MKPPLNRRQPRVKRMIERYGNVSLYDSLHHVGDDPIKSEIEADLGRLLDDESLRVVRAVFGFWTDEGGPNEA